LPGFLAVTKAPAEALRMPGSTYSQDTIEDEKRAAQRTSIQLFYACIAGFVGGVFWLIAFASPYWLSSWEDTQSPFSNMGLWEFCFDHFRYPKFQFDRVFTGCAMTWGDEYRLVREWLMPWWLILVQLFAGIAFIVSFSSQIIDVCLLLRMPMEHILRFEFNLVLITFVMKSITAVLLLLILILFGSCCWDRGWLLYPNYHYVSWSYAMAGFAMLIHGGAAYLMSLEMAFAKDRKEANQALLMQMYPTAGFDFGGHTGSLSTYHGSQFI